MGDPQNEWFIMENPIYINISRYPYFRKLPYSDVEMKADEMHLKHLY